MTTSRAPAPPELVDARAALTAARRAERKLARQLDSTGGLDLFAGQQGSLTSQVAAARAAVARCEESVNDLRPGRSRFRVVRATPATSAGPAASVASPASTGTDTDAAAPTTTQPAAPTVAFLRPAAIGPLLAECRTLEAIANDPQRPQGVEPLRAQLASELSMDGDRAMAMRAARLSVPATLRGQFTEPIMLLESRMLADWHRLRDLDRPDHPAAAAQRAWDDAHRDVDARLEAARVTLSAAVAAAAREVSVVPALPASVSDAGRSMWVEAAARQLAYRERYDVTDLSPLGDEPWDPEQRAEWDQARKALAEVGVEIESRVEAAERLRHEAATAPPRRSLKSVLDRAVDSAAIAR